MSARGAPEAVRRYFEAINAEDWESLADLWSEGAELVAPGAAVQGRREIVAYYASILAPYPVHHDEPVATHVAGDTVTVEVAFRGRTRRGVPVEFDAVDLFTLAAGRIRRLGIWYDVERVRQAARRPASVERRLEDQLERAQRTPFYRRRLRECGLDASVGLADFGRLPPTLPGEVGENMHADHRVPAAIVGGIPLTAADLDDEARVRCAGLAVAGVGPGDLVRPASPLPAWERAVSLVGATLVWDPGGQEAPLLVGREPGGMRPIQILERPETGLVAIACPRTHGLHVLVNEHLVEVVEGRLLVTPLGRRALPVLRFAVADSAAWLHGRCACGSALPRVVLGDQASRRA